MSVPNLYSFKSYKGVLNFEIWSRDSGHAHLWDSLWFVRRKGASSIYVPNLKWIAQLIQKLYGSQNFEIGSCDPKLRPF